ncbi:hypothetical protein [Priestia sp. GS2]|uniref:hypothetical protein n=1 Tax=Priestia sp. GS2 TaxID=3117403 RepID=UPI002ED7916C
MHMKMLKQSEEAEQKEKEFDRYIRYLSMVHSHPIQGNQEALRIRQKFEESIRPKEEVKELKQEDLAWDFEKEGGE